MGVAFNAAVVNEFNKNGDGMDTVTAKDVLQQFYLQTHKYRTR